MSTPPASNPSSPQVEEFIVDGEEGIFARDVDGHLIRMDKVTAEDFDTEIELEIDGLKIKVKKAVPATDSQGKQLKDAQGRNIPRATTIYDAAAILYKDRPEDNPIPIVCHREYMDPVAVCRLCVVEISKFKRGSVQRERKLLPACQHRVEPTMLVKTLGSSDEKARERIRSSVALLTEMLMADHPSPCAKEQQQSGSCELEALAGRLGVSNKPRFPRREPRGKDESSLVIAVDHAACILCDRCVRGCNDIQNNQVIGRMGKGYNARIAFDLDEPMGSSTCVSCGECMVSCPTGALTFRAPVEANPWANVDPPAMPVDPEALINHPIQEVRRVFAGVAPTFLRFNASSIVRRKFKKGQIICKEGQFGFSAFLIEEGSVEVRLRTPQRHVEDKVTRGLFGLVRKFTSRFATDAEAPREEDKRDQGYITTDSAPEPLKLSDPKAIMRVGDLFGEMTCMNNYPRSATVIATEDCTLLEMLRNVLYIMQRTPSFREVLERNYRERAINNHLRSVPIFASLRSDEARFTRLVEYLKPRVVLRRCEPGETIFRQGAPADDGFYLVRTGFVKVSQKRPGGENVLNYIGPGGHFGEVGLLSDIAEIRALAPAGVRTATCAALDHVDLVRITAADFRDILTKYPDDLRRPLIEEALQRLMKDQDAINSMQSNSLGAFLGQGLMNAQSLLVLDLEKCTRCDECTKACADAHEGVTRLIREGLRFDKFLVASSCRSCLDPYCMVGCPVGSIQRSGTGEIVIKDWCIGCGKCADNCPYGNINMHPFATDERAPDPDNPARMIPVMRSKATTCDLCRDLGPNAEPSCVYACPHDAAHRMKGEDLRSLVEGIAGM